MSGVTSAEEEHQERPPGLVDLDPQNMLLRQRIIFLGGAVDDNSADAIISQLLLLNATDDKTDIKLFINSPGGSVTAGMGIYDAMQLCSCDISTVCFGLAASMGAFLLSAGTKGKRYAMPNARIMIHQPLGGGRGSAIDFAIQAQEIIYHRDNLNRILSLNTGKPASQIELDCDRDNFMDPWEATEYGLIDNVIEVPNIVSPKWLLAEPPKTKINEYWTVRKRKEIKMAPKKDRKPITRQT